MTPREERLFMYVGYIDDSGSTGENLNDPYSRFQVIGGPIIRDANYVNIEARLSARMGALVPEEQWDCFEFHAADLFHGNLEFEMDQTKRWQLIEDALNCLRELRVPIVYGAIDKAELNRKLYRTADPAQMAFDLYLGSLKKWFDQIPVQPESGIIICDESRKDIRHAIQTSFRRNRRKPKLENSVPGFGPVGTVSGLGNYLFDEIYFGESKSSCGIQLADICVFFISRHLAQRPESEGFYNIIHGQIFDSKVYPSKDDDLREKEQ